MSPKKPKGCVYSWGDTWGERLMTDEEFNRYAARTNLQASSRLMARRVLVDGITAARAGREQGKSRVLASRAALTVKRAALTGPRCPHCGAMPDPKVVR